MNSFLACLLLTVVPQASLVSPDKSLPGATVLLDARASVSDFPLAWTVTPTGPILLQMDQDGRTGVVGLFTAVEPGEYDVVLAASGWTDEAKTKFGLSIAAHKITVGRPTPPTPPTPPQPTDPLALAAKKYHDGCGVNYGVAATSIHARNSYKDTQAALKKSMNDTFSSCFAQWAAAFPPNGTEPTNESQWTTLEGLMTAISGAFK